MRKRILFVDDEPTWRGRVAGSLCGAGYCVLAAADASEALVWAADQPDLGLIIVDDCLAGESGPMLTRFLHRNYPDVPIVLYITSEYDAATILELKKHGVSRFLPKGTMDELIAVVGSYLS